MDFSVAGVKEGLIKFAKIVLYVAISGALTALIDYFKPLTTGEFGVVYVAINGLLGFLKTWVMTKRVDKK